MKKEEQKNQIALLRWASYHKEIYPYLIHIRNEGKRSLIGGHIANLMGMKKGVSDLFFCRPNVQYHGFWIELKSKTGKLSSSQKEFIELMRSQKYKAEVYYNWADAMSDIIEYVLNKKATSE